MKCIVNILILVIITANQLPSQSKDRLFLVMAYVDNFERDTTGGRNVVPIQPEYHKILYNVEADTLVVFDTLNVAPNHNLNRIIQYSDKQFFYLEEKSMFKIGSPNYFSILDYSGDSVIIRRYNSDEDADFWGYSAYPEAFFIDNDIWINIQYKRKLNYRALNRYCTFRVIKVDDYQRVYRSGVSSPFQYQPGFLYQYPFIHLEKNRKSYNLDDLYEKYKNEIGSKLKITIGIHLKDYEQMPDSWIQIPRELRDSTISGVWVAINNDNYFVGGGVSKLKTEEGFAKSYRWIYDKKTEAIDTLLFDGQEDYRLKIYKDWLYGTAILKSEVFSSRYNRDTPEGREALYEKNRQITGGKYNLRNGKPPFLLNKTDQLILIHLPTKRKIKWHTGDIDSEILLAEGDKIYFRVYDEIRCVDIDLEKNAIAWSSETVIVKDKDIIPFVHHIFFSSTAQKKMEEVWINPGKAK